MMPGISNVYIEASFRGHKAIPGKYSAILKYQGQESTQEFEILPNPKYPKDIDYAVYEAFMSELESNLSEMHKMCNTLHKKRLQMKKVLGKLGDSYEHEQLKTSGIALIKEMKAWDEAMVQRKSQAYDDVENFPNKFTANYMFMMNQTESDIPRINQASRERRAELEQEWNTLKVAGQELLDIKLTDFNKQLWEAGIGAIWDE
jgi:DNA-binding transcriptional MerR regulator